jgi:hypothetical protein
MPSYILLLHQESGRRQSATPDELTTMRQAYMGWAERMQAAGKLRGGEKLSDDAGRVLRRSQDRVAVTDGPYTESKELVAGYFILAAEDYDEACRLAEGCPHLTYGGRIEVRQIDPM